MTACSKNAGDSSRRRASNCDRCLVFDFLHGTHGDAVGWFFVAVFCPVSFLLCVILFALLQCLLVGIPLRQFIEIFFGYAFRIFPFFSLFFSYNGNLITSTP